MKDLVGILVADTDEVRSGRVNVAAGHVVLRKDGAVVGPYAPLSASI